MFLHNLTLGRLMVAVFIGLAFFAIVLTVGAPPWLALLVALAVVAFIALSSPLRHASHVRSGGSLFSAESCCMSDPDAADRVHQRQDSGPDNPLAFFGMVLRTWLTSIAAWFAVAGRAQRPADHFAAG